MAAPAPNVAMAKAKYVRAANIMPLPSGFGDEGENRINRNNSKALVGEIPELGTANRRRAGGDPAPAWTPGLLVNHAVRNRNSENRQRRDHANSADRRG